MSFSGVITPSSPEITSSATLVPPVAVMTAPRLALA